MTNENVVDVELESAVGPRGVDVRIHVRDRSDARGPDGEWMMAWSEDRFVEYA